MTAFFKRFVLHNFGLKLLSLGLAAGLWLLISPGEHPAEVALRGPIVFQNVPSSIEISSESIPEAQIRVRGPERIIRRLQANEVPDASYDPYEPTTEWFTGKGKEEVMPLSGAPEPKRRWVPSKWEKQKVHARCIEKFPLGAGLTCWF